MRRNFPIGACIEFPSTAAGRELRTGIVVLTSPFMLIVLIDLRCSHPAGTGYGKRHGISVPCCLDCTDAVFPEDSRVRLLQHPEVP